MKDFERLQQICLDEVRAAGITPGKIGKWVINSRAKSRWGSCTMRENGEYEIQIAEVLLVDDHVSEVACKETMIHEILHTCKGGANHSGLWLEYANKMNKQYGYNIKRTTSMKEKGIEETYVAKQLDYKYLYRCETCGQTIFKKKACPFTRNYRNYTCLICGTEKAFHKITEKKENQ